MILKVFIALLALNCVIAKFDDLSISSDEFLSRERRDDDDGWESRLLLWSQLITGLVEGNANVSIIGWQNIYNSDGTIKEVDTIEIAFPVKYPSRLNEFEDDNEAIKFRSDQHRTIKNLDHFINLKKYGLLVNIFVEVFVGDDESSLFYWTPSTTYFRVDSLVSFNKTVVASKEEVEEFVKNLPEFEARRGGFALRPLIMKHNADGVLITPEDDIWGPSALTYVVELSNASDDIVLKGPTVATQIFVKCINKREEIPEQLAKKFDETFPKYDWRVLVNPDEFYLLNDVFIKLSVDGFEFYGGEKPIYMVYGVEKTL